MCQITLPTFLKILIDIYYYYSFDLPQLYCCVHEKTVLHHCIIGTSGCLVDLTNILNINDYCMTDKRSQPLCLNL